MAKFYGTIIGNHGEATREGSAKSGFKASCQSYEGSVIVEMYENKEGQTRVRLGTSDRSSSYITNEEICMSLDELNDAIRLLKEIREKKASVTHHRAKSNTQLQLESLGWIK